MNIDAKITVKLDRKAKILKQTCWRYQSGQHILVFVLRSKDPNRPDFFFRTITKGKTNDDLIALNAEDCHTAIRMLSFVSPIRNIRFENVVAGCRAYAINMGAARYCRTPLFDDRDFPKGVGCVENIEIDTMKVWFSSPGNQKALIDCENRVKNFVIRNLERDLRADQNPKVSTFIMDKIPGTRIQAQHSGQKLLETISSSESITLQSFFTDLQLG